MVILAVETYDQSYEVDEILHWFQFTFILIFFIEFILKISAFRQHYFADGLNVLDFVVLVMLIIGKFKCGDVVTVPGDLIVLSLVTEYFDSFSCKIVVKIKNEQVKCALIFV